MANKWLDDYKTAERLVNSVLRDYPDTRRNDKELMIKIWEVQGLKLTDEQKFLFGKCLPAETIRRSRQKIQEMGAYRPEKPVYEQRKLLDDEISSFMASKKN
jgi:hypothetical protein